MKPKTFTEVVQAFLSTAIVLVLCWLALMYSDYKDALINAAMLALGFWLGSSRGSQQKDENAPAKP